MSTDPFDLMPPGNPQSATQPEIGPIIDDIADDDESEETSPT